MSYLKFAGLLVLSFGVWVVFAGDPPGPVAGSAWMMSDGDNVYPTNSAATPTQVEAVKAAQVTLSARVDDGYANCTNALAQADAALDVVKFANQDDIVVSEVFITSIGSPAAAGTNQIINILGFTVSGAPVTNIHVIAEFDQLQTSEPGLDWRSALTADGESDSDWLALTNVACSWPTTVEHVDAVYPFVYSFDVPVVGAPETLFVRVISHDDGGAGSSYYFIISNGLIINGHMGRSATIVDDAGGTNTFEAGLLVGLLEESL